MWISREKQLTETKKRNGTTNSTNSLPIDGCKPGNSTHKFDFIFGHVWFRETKQEVVVVILVPLFQFFIRSWSRLEVTFSRMKRILGVLPCFPFLLPFILAWKSSWSSRIKTKNYILWASFQYYPKLVQYYFFYT